MIRKCDDASFTGLVGHVMTTYSALVKAFGAPHYVDEDKSTVEWDFKTDSGVIFTIYDWKTSSTPTGNYNWHIGGHDSRAVDAVRAYFPNAYASR